MSPEVHGHRGCAGPFPENTIPAFRRALELGCTWIEMDVVITGDGNVLVSHEPWMDPRICRNPDGGRLGEEEGRALNIFRMSLSEVQAFPCAPATKALTIHADWHKPTLAEVVQAMDRHTFAQGSEPAKFNIEIKSELEWYGTYQPLPALFAEHVLNACAELHIGGRCLVQSFDVAVLGAVHGMDPDMPVALLVDNTQDLETNLQRLDFTPRYYSPAFTLVDETLVEALRRKGIGLLAWTVNEAEDIRRMIASGVDGIITDHPERVLEELGTR